MTGTTTLGWREWISFPELGIPQIKAKVDTGARTSCLHAFMIEKFERGGTTWLRFAIHPSQYDNNEVIHCEAPMKDERIVRDSGGHEELRYVIETSIGIGETVRRAELTLTDRDAMKFRALLGRTSLREHYTVDPGRSYLVGKRKRQARTKKNAVA